MRRECFECNAMMRIRRSEPALDGIQYVRTLECPQCGASRTCHVYAAEVLKRPNRRKEALKAKPETQATMFDAGSTEPPAASLIAETPRS
jgi:hypothetical protein